MIDLNKTQLSDVLEIFFLANTPRSLLWGMTRTDAVRRLRQSTAQELLAYYDRLTTRAKRSEVVVALSYALLCAILLRGQDGDRVTVDAGRLLWGEQIKSYFERASIPAGLISVRTNIAPEIHSNDSPSSASNLTAPTGAGHAGLLGPDGRPVASWRNG